MLLRKSCPRCNSRSWRWAKCLENIDEKGWGDLWGRCKKCGAKHLYYKKVRMK